MKRFFSLNSISNTIKKFGDRKNAADASSAINLHPERAGTHKRLSNLSTNSLNSKQSYLNIEVIREGYNVDLTRVDNTFTKLHRACLLNYDERKLVKYIKKQPASINQIDNVANCSPLHLCVVSNNLRYLTILLQSGGDVNLADGRGKTLLIKAIECSNEQMVQFLIQSQADVNKPDAKYKNSPLHWACLTGFYKGISILLNCTRINVNQANANEETALHLIAKSNKNLYVFINDCLDNNGIDLDKQDLKGRTPLFIACLSGNYHCVDILLKNNADPRLTNLVGESSLQIAKSKNFVDIVDLFEKNTTNQYLREMRNSSKTITGRVNNHQTASKPVANQPGLHLNGAPNSLTVKRDSVFSQSSDIDFFKTNSNEEDSWPETASNSSVESKRKAAAVVAASTKVKQLHVQDANEDQTSFNSFKMNTNVPTGSSSPSPSNHEKNAENVKHSSARPNQDLSEIRVNTRDETPAAKPVLHPENDEFIKQMKFLIDEEIEMNEELDQMLFINAEVNRKDQPKSKVPQPQTSNIYLSDEDDWADENDTLIKKPDISPMINDDAGYQSVKRSNNSLTKKSLIYGLSDEEEEQKANGNGKDASSDSTFSSKNQTDKVAALDKPNDSQINRDLSNQQNGPTNGQNGQQPSSQTPQATHRANQIYISNDSSLSSDRNSKEEDLVGKFDALMAKVSDFEQQNQKLTSELSEALEREQVLKQLNRTLNQQFEEQNHELNLLENRLRQSDQNYALVKAESEQFKADFKAEREKFEKEFVQFIQEEHKQTEQHLMRLLDDKQEMCDKLTDELNYLKERYVNREQVPLANDDLISKLESNQMFVDLMQQNERMNQNFQDLQRSLEEHQVLTESVKKLSQILLSLEEQLKQQASQFGRQLSSQQNEFGQFMESNVVQYIQNLFKTEVELKLSQVKSVVDELKHELLEFIENYKLPKKNEQEITGLINQILAKSIRQSSIDANTSDEELKMRENNPIKSGKRPSKGARLIAVENTADGALPAKRAKEEEESISIKDEENKTSLEFDADDLFNDEKRPSDKEIEIKSIKKIKKNRAQLFWQNRTSGDQPQTSARLVGQYSDAILNSVGAERLVTDELDREDLDRNGLNQGRVRHKSSLNGAELKLNYYESYEGQSNGLNQLNYLNYLHAQQTNRNQLNHLNQSKFIASRSKSIHLANDFNLSARSLNVLEPNPETTTDFHKRCHLVEQEISNLKIQLGLYSSNRFRSVSAGWNL